MRIVCSRRTRALLVLGLLLGSTGVSTAASGQPLGRLFMTPGERAALEQLRRSGPVGAAPQTGARTGTISNTPANSTPDRSSHTEAERRPGDAPAPNEMPAPVAAALKGQAVIVVNGVVRRTGAGAVMTWVDAVPYPGTARLQGGAVLGTGQGGQVTVVLRSGQRVSLKPGQEVDTASGKVREAYLRRGP